MWKHIIITFSISLGEAFSLFNRSNSKHLVWYISLAWKKKQYKLKRTFYKKILLKGIKTSLHSVQNAQVIKPLSWFTPMKMFIICLRWKWDAYLMQCICCVLYGLNRLQCPRFSFLHLQTWNINSVISNAGCLFN